MALPTASDNVFPKVIIQEAAAPASPSATQFKLYVDSSDHLLKYKNSAGTVVTLGTGLTDPMTTRGDILVRNSSNVTARLAVGAAGKILSSDGTDAAWGNGPMTTAGDIIIGGASGTPTRLAAGATSGHVLTSNGSGVAPSYQAGGAGGGLAQSYVGYNTIGGTWTAMVVRRIYLKKVTLAAAATFTAVEAYVRANTDNFCDMSGVLLTDSAGVPDLLIGEVASHALLLSDDTSPPAPGRWFSLPLGYHVAAGDYWFGVAAGVITGASYFDLANDASGSDVYWTTTGAYVSGSHTAFAKTTSAVKNSIRASILS